jgi:hypothetical protein
LGKTGYSTILSGVRSRRREEDRKGEQMSYRDEFSQAQKEVYWSLPRILVLTLVALAFVYLVGFLTTGGDLAIYRFWAPKQENAKRVVFENTQSYVQGKTQYISKLRYQYQSAAPGAQKDALKTLILDEASTVDNSKLPLDLQGFIQQLKGSL